MYLLALSAFWLQREHLESAERDAERVFRECWGSAEKVKNWQLKYLDLVPMPILSEPKKQKLLMQIENFWLMKMYIKLFIID